MLICSKMRNKINEKIQLGEGVSCEYTDNILKFKKGSVELERTINIPIINIRVKDNELILEATKGNKIQYKRIKSQIAHIKNLIRGLNNEFVYELEACNVHFPMTLKVVGDKVLINNFLGEKQPRSAIITKGVKVEINGVKVIVKSNDLESAGQTAANLEKATKIKGRDRRVFQDGVYIVKKPERAEAIE